MALEEHALTDLVDPPKPVRAWTVTGLVVVFTMIDYADKAVLGLANQPLSAELHLSATELGFIGGISSLPFCITAIGAGFVADRVRAQRVLVVLSLIWAACQLSVVFSAHAGTLLAGRIVLGAADGPAGAMAAVAVFGWFTETKRALPAAWVTSGASLAKIAIAPILAVVVGAFGWRAGFASLGVAGVAWASVFVWAGKDGPYAAANAQAARAGARVPFRRIVFSRTFVGASLGALPMYALATIILTWLPAYFERALGFGRTQSGVMFGLPSIAAMAAMLVVSAASDRFAGRGRASKSVRALPCAIGLVAGGLLLAFLPLVHDRILAVAVVSVGYGLGSLVFPLMVTTVSELAPRGQQAGAVGLFLGGYGLAGLAGPWVTGLLLDRVADPATGYGLAFATFGLLAACGGVAVRLLVDPARDRS